MVPSSRRHRSLFIFCRPLYPVAEEQNVKACENKIYDEFLAAQDAQKSVGFSQKVQDFHTSERTIVPWTVIVTCYCGLKPWLVH